MGEKLITRRDDIGVKEKGIRRGIFRGKEGNEMIIREVRCN